MEDIFGYFKKKYKDACKLALDACSFFTIVIAANQISDKNPSTNVAISSVVFLTLQPLLSPVFVWFTGAYNDEEDKYLSYSKAAIKECKAVVPLQIQNAAFIGVWFLFLKFHYTGKSNDVDFQNAGILLESSAAFLFAVDPLFVKILIRAISSCLHTPWKEFFQISTDEEGDTPCKKIRRDYLESIKLAIYIALFSVGVYGSNKLIEKENFVHKDCQQLMSLLITAPVFLFIKPFIDVAPFLLKKKNDPRAHWARFNSDSSYESVENRAYYDRRSTPSGSILYHSSSGTHS